MSRCVAFLPLFRHRTGAVQSLVLTQVYVSQRYLQHHFGVRLNHPDLPLVETKSGTYYPMELLHVYEVRHDRMTISQRG